MARPSPGPCRKPKSSTWGLDSFGRAQGHGMLRTVEDVHGLGLSQHLSEASWAQAKTPGCGSGLIIRARSKSKFMPFRVKIGWGQGLPRPYIAPLRPFCKLFQTQHALQAGGSCGPLARGGGAGWAYRLSRDRPRLTDAAGAIRCRAPCHRRHSPASRAAADAAPAARLGRRAAALGPT